MKRVDDMSNKNKKANKKPGIKNTTYMIRLAFKASPKRVFFDFFIRIVENANSLFFSLVFYRFIFNAVEKNTSFSSIIKFMIMSALIFIVADLLKSYYYNVFRPVNDTVLYENLNAILFDKVTDVELACFENTEFYDNYTKAANETRGRIITVLDSSSSIIASIIAVITTLLVLLTVDVFSMLFILFLVIITYFLGKKGNKISYELYKKNIINYRKKDYMKRTAYLQHFAKEIRLTNVFNVLRKGFNNSVAEIIKNIKKYGFRIGIFRSLHALASEQIALIGALTYGAVRMLVFKNILIGDFVILFNALLSFSESSVSLTNNIISLHGQGLYIQNLKSFMEYVPTIQESQEGIEPSSQIAHLILENLSFRYSDKTDLILNNINISIKPGEKIALVGQNGAGKSTLIKLIMRLYDPTNGKICYGNHDIRELTVSSYRNLFATVFQDFQILSLSVKDNILMGHMDIDNSLQNAIMNSEISEYINDMKMGIDTTLTKEFDEEGAVLSGGQYQKIAIARVFAKIGTHIAIFDEPSSALDPIAEYNFYENMLEACAEKTTIFISHRLSSATIADRVFFMENGEIVEEGSHSQLMKNNGKYAYMFNIQAKKYAESEDTYEK